MTTVLRATTATATAIMVLASTTAAQAAGRLDGTWPAHRLAATTTGDDAMRHLRAYDRIARRNGGVRATGTPGFAASDAYTARVLERAGYRVYRQEVPYEDYRIDAERADVLTPANRPVRVLMMRFSPVTPPEGLTAPLVVAPVTESGGCTASDYDGLPVRGSIVLVRRGSCGYTAQQRVAATLGAKAMLVYMATPSPGNIWRLHAFDRSAVTIPVASVSQEQGERLAADAARGTVSLRLRLRGHSVTGTTSNLFAETRGGDPACVVMAGAHLDSVTESPGINDNAAAVAALLATAQRLAPYQRRVRNKVRFAFWGAEELPVVGSTHYVRTLSPEQRADIALYLNFELLAAPNHVRFLMDGDAGDQPPGTTPGPPGSGAIEDVFRAYLRPRGLPFKPQNMRAVGSDHEPFAQAGIPVGGINGGAFAVKTEEEAKVFGGQAGRLYDWCYHQACDTIDNIDRRALDENVPAIAYAVGRFAADVSQVEGAR
ncbi:M28 family peptidase [Thermomonospora cellulosilytica]|uniref:N-acetylated-alpha-linked acidic dipeptidase n=1 Tax=Thermomonospora cellulosilytica TaxID=1411118 RepID=A0A7W3RCK7_9ACTN|nr:M28 family peptidase [Thermomonospora cellulosilytica]MBA9007934.1 N-acetylated-alpha-linked acidic dipeptidase [Thermomonospora cellulosilytica]